MALTDGPTVEFAPRAFDRLLRVGWPWIFGRFAAPPRRLACCALLASSTVRRWADIRRHLRQDFRHCPRIDLRSHFDQDVGVEPVEDFRGIARLHVLVHGDEALEARGFGVVLLLRFDLDLLLDLLELGELARPCAFRRPGSGFRGYRVRARGCRVPRGAPASARGWRARHRSAAPRRRSGSTVPFGGSAGLPSLPARRRGLCRLAARLLGVAARRLGRRPSR